MGPHNGEPATTEGVSDAPIMEHTNSLSTTTIEPAIIVQAVCDDLRGRVSPAESELVNQFTHLFYSKAPVEFFHDRPIDVLSAVALSAFRHLQQARPERVEVAVRNPADEPEPWDAEVTVIRTNVTERPFIVDSLREYLHVERLAVERFLHPVMRVVRGEAGEILELGPASAGDPRESVIHCEIAALDDADMAQRLEEGLRTSLEDVVVATTDFGAMVNALNETVAYLEEAAHRAPARQQEIEEVQEFLRWLRQGSFILLGFRAYDVVETAAGPAAVVEPGSGLGLLRDDSRSDFAAPIALDSLSPDMRERIAGTPLLVLNKTDAESTVHRRVRMDSIGVKKLDAAGNPAGERRFIGLFTSRAYSEDAEGIPMLRQKLQAIIERGGWLEESHDYKEAISIFNSMPKEELFIASAEEIGKEIEAILTRYHTQEVKVTMRRDRLERGVSIMVIMPKERYSGRARRALQAELVRQYEGTLLNYHLVMGGGDQARLHFYIAAPPERLGAVVPGHIEQMVSHMIRTWTDSLELELAETRSGQDARRLAARWGTAFSQEYQAATTPAEAVADMEAIEQMEAAGETVALRLSNAAGNDNLGADEPVTRLKVYLRDERLVLSDFMPILENAGLRVIAMSPFEAADAAGASAMIYLFAVQGPDHAPIDLEQRRGLLTEMILAVRAGHACNDVLNALGISAGLAWREVEMLRAYCEYAFQLKVVPSRLALPSALRAYPSAARALVTIFNEKFDPSTGLTIGQRLERLAELRQGFIDSLEHVTALADDRALRRLLALIDATARTNYFVHGGTRPTTVSGGVPFIAYKFLSELLMPLVKTRLRAEVWVQSARMAGIHMRTGKVSRGGLRHSDRPDDFRTEVHGLVRTQAVKNAVIVPAGSKGGFVIRNHPADPKELAAEVQAQYRTLIRGLLDITDNLVNNELARPESLVVYDEVDPYLVVAADKGTAKFSDVANSVAADYGFWLDDAFASGGSNGYDHKAVGITARGGWECVRRHFREMGIDIQAEPFTVVGIGDMSGDVFGNGMLLSRKIRLLAAFDHRHIFVDPDPDPETSFVERQRLFELGRSSWGDYDKELLSKGGFVVARGIKEMEIPAEARAALGVPDEVGRVDGESLIRLILQAPADLLWNGGIGTYVKATDETHAEVGDTANDAVRIDATELRARVLGEGGNLGLTQKARVQFALNGGRCYTDAIDNSGGVEMSDREVNLKILLNAAMTEGRLDRERRNVLLRELTDSVTDKVLHDNRSQSLAVSLDELRAAESFDDFHTFMVALERNRVMDRRMEALPSLEVLAERRADHQSLVRPELSVLLAYAKLTLKQSLLDSTVLDDPSLERYLRGYFPDRAIAMVGAGPLDVHRLRREIIATELGNDMVDLMGASFLHRITRDTGFDAPQVARAWFIASRLSGARDLRQRLALREGDIASDVIYRWLLGLARVLERTTRWILTNVPAASQAQEVIDEYFDGLCSLRGNFGDVVNGDERELYDGLVAEMRELTGEDELAASLITLRFLDQLLEILKISREFGQSPVHVGQAYYLAAQVLEVPRLRAAISSAVGDNRWEPRAAQALLDDLGRAHRRLAAALVAAGGTGDGVERALEKVGAAHGSELQAFRSLLEEAGGDEHPSLASAVVLLRALGTLSA
jgi:glutamate dehydrogenase